MHDHLPVVLQIDPWRDGTAGIERMDGVLDSAAMLVTVQVIARVYGDFSFPTRTT